MTTRMLAIWMTVVSVFLLTRANSTFFTVVFSLLAIFFVLQLWGTFRPKGVNQMMDSFSEDNPFVIARSNGVSIESDSPSATKSSWLRVTKNGEVIRSWSHDDFQDPTKRMQAVGEANDLALSEGADLQEIIQQVTGGRGNTESL